MVTLNDTLIAPRYLMYNVYKIEVLIDIDSKSTMSLEL